MRRLPPWTAGAGPALLSVALSLSTVGGRVHWQDSGFFIAGVKDLGVLYPHGFVLYLLACKAWTLFFPGGETFTLAVHLFSSACAAVAAGCLGMAGRELLLAKGPLRTGFDVAEDRATACGAAAACLAASGYTFWLSGIYAKPYAMLYAALAGLLWAMVRCSETRSPRALTVVAALIGLSWAVHPAATGAGLALLAFTGVHYRTLGPRGLAWRVVLSASCALAPSLLLPVLSSRMPAVMFGELSGVRDLLDYLLASRFTGHEGTFRLESDRWATMAEYAWEEFLGAAMLLLAAGAWALARTAKPLLAGILSWIAPFTLLATAFRMEGQQDHWYVAAWLPAWLVVAAGLARLPRSVSVLLTGLGLSWAGAANAGDVNLRGYPWAERFAELLLTPLPRGAMLVVGSDDGASTTFHAQVVRGLRRDVNVIRAAHLDVERGWYERRLMAEDPRLRPVTYRRRAGLRRVSSAADFAIAQAAAGHAVYLDLPITQDLLPKGWSLVAAGALYHLVPPGGERPAPITYPLDPRDVRQAYRRFRGVRQAGPDGRRPREPYERRLLIFLLRAKLEEARGRMNAGDVDGALAGYSAIVDVDPEAGRQEEVAFPMAVLLQSKGRIAEAVSEFRKVAEEGQDPVKVALSCASLAAAARSSGDPVSAGYWERRARSIPNLPPGIRAEVDRLLGR